MGSGVKLCFEKTLDMPFLVYYGASAVFYWGTPLWEIVYYADTCIVYLAVRETLISHACANSGVSCKRRPGNEAMLCYTMLRYAMLSLASQTLSGVRSN